ncbi:MAG: iron ABC transporter permease [Clostridia bacterium]|nr:iron ABC transporter permease [Clostridia bacterium]
MKPSNRKAVYPILAISGGALILTMLLSLLLGGASLSPAEALGGLFGVGNGTASVIMQGIRLPRALGAILAGVGLSVAGVLLQSVTDNALASPNVIGVNSGAGFFVILLLAFFPAASPLLPLAAFVGAFLTTLVIIGTAGRFGASRATVILAGIALTSILNAAISLISLIDTDVLSAYSYFSVGGLSGLSFDRLPLPAILIVLSFVGALTLSRQLEALRLGDTVACALGIRVRPLRTVALICASASAAAAVSFAGLLGFVGLIVPHVARKLVGGYTRHVLIASATLGGTLVLLADLLGRTLLSPTEIPVGIIMALVGAPFFLFLLIRGNRHA